MYPAISPALAAAFQRYSKTVRIEDVSPPKPRVVRAAHWRLTEADNAALDTAAAKRLAKNARRLAQRDRDAA